MLLTSEWYTQFVELSGQLSYLVIRRSVVLFLKRKLAVVKNVGVLSSRSAQMLWMSPLKQNASFSFLILSSPAATRR